MTNSKDDNEVALDPTWRSDKAHEAICEAAERIANCYCSEDDTYSLEVRRLTVGISDVVDPRLRADSAAPVVDQRRLEIALGYIKRAANRELPKLPCRVDEMTEREVAIFKVGAAAVGNLQFIARELDALPAAAPRVTTGNRDNAIRLLRELREINDPVEIKRHKEGWQRLQEALNPAKPSGEATQRAAREISERWHNQDLPFEASIHSLRLLQLQTLAEHVIKRYFAAAPVGESWLPIETAPKDGTAILVYGPELLREIDGHCAVVRWQTNDNSTYPWWTISDGKFGPYDLRGPSPTHWMPLPTEPSQSKGEGEG